MITHHLRFISQIIWINTDTMPSNKSWIEFEKVPLCTGSFKNRFGIDSHFIKDNGKLVHERYIDVTLTVLYNLCCFGDLNVLCSMYSCFNNQLIHIGYTIKSFIIHARNNFLNSFQTMNFIARINTFRAITYFEIYSAFKARLTLKDRHTNIFCHTRING